MLAPRPIHPLGHLRLDVTMEEEMGVHDDAALIAVGACGICRSDWHGWMGHDPTIRPPHVPGHELAGTVAAVGAAVRRWRGSRTA